VFTSVKWGKEESLETSEEVTIQEELMVPKTGMKAVRSG
jgi:hypothetical protein